MNEKELISLITFKDWGQEYIPKLEKLVNNYPYFQPAIVSYLKNLKETGNLSFNYKLQKFSYKIQDKKKLYKILFLLQLKKNKKTLHIDNVSVQAEEYSILNKEIEANLAISTYQKELEKEINTSEIKEIKPLKAEQNKISQISDKIEKKEDSEIKLTFIQWLKKIDDSTWKEELNSAESFLKKTDNIKKANFYSPDEMAKKSLKFNDDLITETLAKLYENQQLFDDAINAYKKLSLKYPQKSSYFAERIKKINKKIKK